MHFSKRTEWNTEESAMAQAHRERVQAGLPVADLTASNPTRCGFQYAPGLLDPLKDERALAYDPQPLGLSSAREAVCEYYATHGASVRPEKVVLTTSTSEAYSYLFKLLCDPGNEILVPQPSYPLFDFLADLDDVSIRSAAMVYDHGWQIDPEGLRRVITPGTRAIVLVHPNNPTGSYVKRTELDALVSLCSERRLALISDEVFSDYDFAPDPHRAGTLASMTGCLAFAMSGLSKIAGLPQMKLGWTVVGGPADLRAEAFEKLEWIADTYLSVSTPVQCAARVLLDAGEQVQMQIRERCATHLSLAREVLTGSPANILNVEGGWYITVQVPRVRSEEEWTLELLARENVLVQPGFFYDFDSEAYLVVSLLTAPEVFREGIERLRRQLDGA